jgi:hypothetical protein
MADGLYENGKLTHLHFHEAQKAIYYLFFPMIPTEFSKLPIGYHEKIIIIIIIKSHAQFLHHVKSSPT